MASPLHRYQLVSVSLISIRGSLTELWSSIAFEMYCSIIATMPSHWWTNRTTAGSLSSFGTTSSTACIRKTSAFVQSVREKRESEARRHLKKFTSQTIPFYSIQKYGCQRLFDIFMQYCVQNDFTTWSHNVVTYWTTVTWSCKLKTKYRGS